MRCASARLTLALSTVSLLAAGCASPRRVLVNPGDLYLTRGAERIHVSPDSPLVIEWEANGVRYSTADLGSASGQPVLVRLVEANERVIRVKSKAWEGMDDIPVSVRDRSGIRVTAQSGRYKHPTAAIPVDSIATIGVYDLLPRLERTGPRDVLYGIGAGATGAMVSCATDPPLFPDQDEGVEVLAGTVIVGVAGGIVYPVWRMFRPKYRQEPVEYTIGDAGYRVEIR